MAVKEGTGNGCGDAQTLLKHVFGNLMKVAIPLTIRIRTMTEGVETETEEDFYPNTDMPISVVLHTKFGFSKAYTPSVSGNVVTFTDDGTLPVGIYNVTVLCYDSEDRPYRYMVVGVIKVVSATADAGIEAGIEFDSQDYVLEGAVFFYAKGDRGQSIYDYCVEYEHYEGTEEEFTQDYVDSVQAAKDAAAAANRTNEEVTQAEQLRVSAENGRVNAESSRVSAESDRVSAESLRVSAESTRAGNEQSRTTEFNEMRITAQGDHNIAGEDHSTAQTDHSTAESDHSASVSQSAYAKNQGDYAKEQGDYAKAQGDLIVFATAQTCEDIIEELQ